ncbi:SH3 domain-containing protein [Streptomyces microflavus]|uniref:SH3 domain-containing protein n=1 Tax=Streptomyces microflavus TaxID=1919 RepID=UPI003319E1A4
MTLKSFNRAMTIGFRTVAASALTAAVVLGGTAATAQAAAPAATTATKAPAAEKWCKYKVTTTAGINIRSGPGTNHTIVGTYSHNQQFWGKAASSNGWRQVGAARYVTTQYTTQVTSVTCQYS